MTQIDNFLKRHSSVGFDANVLIGLIESNPEYGKTARAIFQAFGRHHNHVWTSVITIVQSVSASTKEPYGDYPGSFKQTD